MPVPAKGRAELDGGGRCPSAVIAEPFTCPVRGERQIIEQHHVGLMVESHDDHVIGAAVELRMQEVHGSFPPHGLRESLAIDDHPGFDYAPLLHEQGEQVVLIVEAPRPELVAVPTLIH